MTIDLPAGYLTRPEAAKKYNRSQRALERDLDVALTIQDEELLSHWKLVTKDGIVRGGGDVTLKLVKQLVSDGMAPAWCIAESFLESKYGRKGAPRPSTLVRPLSESISAESTRESKSQKSSRTSTNPLPDETTFLKGLIQNLEREKEQERQRHDQIVAKLFQQLEVKDKQISAWDGVTQGLTKALATGQITPNIDHLLAPTRTKDSVPSEDDDRRVVDASPVVTSTEEGSGHTQKNTGRTKTKPVNAKRKARNEKEPNSDSRSSESKSKWNTFPTFKKLFSRR